MTMKYFYIEPEVAGEIGGNTILDPSVHPPHVDRLHYEFNIWPADGLVETFPCLCARKDVADALKSAAVTGIEYRKMEVSTTDDVADDNPDRVLPPFIWLHVVGVAGNDDFGIGPDLRFVISERSLDIARPFGLEYADIEPIA